MNISTDLHYGLQGWDVRIEIYDGAGGIWEAEGRLNMLDAEWMQVGDEVIPKTSIARIRRISPPSIHGSFDAD